MKSTRRYVIALQTFGLALGLALAAPGIAQQKKGADDQVFPGDAVCTRCHDGDELRIGKTRHGYAGAAKGMSCTSCHGESRGHVDTPVGTPGRPGPDRLFGDKVAMKGGGAERSAVCIACHADNRHLAFWESGRHAKNEVSCDNCHIIHDVKRSQLRQDNPSISPFVTTSRQLQYETCTNCHKNIRAQIMKPSHHPIIEGKIACSSCHNPHGALSPAMVNSESVNQLCSTCHADKRGPYVFEHPPVEENCLTCHDSHGSAHFKLLKERVPNMCQDCHDWSRHPGTYYSGNQGWNFQPPATAPNTRLVNRACLNCHTNIHGSNAPANRGKFFLR